MSGVGGVVVGAPEKEGRIMDFCALVIDGRWGCFALRTLTVRVAYCGSPGCPWERTHAVMPQHAIDLLCVCVCVCACFFCSSSFYARRCHQQHVAEEEERGRRRAKADKHWALLEELAHLKAGE